MAHTTLEKLTAVRLDLATYKALETLGEAVDRPVAWLIRDAVKQYIDKNAKPAKR